MMTMTVSLAENFWQWLQHCQKQTQQCKFNQKFDKYQNKNSKHTKIHTHKTTEKKKKKTTTTQQQNWNKTKRIQLKPQTPCYQTYTT